MADEDKKLCPFQVNGMGYMQKCIEDKCMAWESRVCSEGICKIIEGVYND